MAMKRVLVVDDEVDLTRIMKRCLEETGLYEVATANAAGAALAEARRFHPDLILLDILMPGANGGRVAAEISADPTLSQVPIIFVTGIVSKTEAGGRGLFSGGRRVLAKPVTVAELTQAIGDVLLSPGDTPAGKPSAGGTNAGNAYPQ
jgi:CheY-like chemotaxis protein